MCTAQLWHAQHNVDLSELAEQRGATEDILKLSELVLVTACVLHDCHNAFRWAMRQGANDPYLLWDCYVAIETLRNSLDLLHLHVAEWVVKHMSFRHHEQGQLWKQVQEGMLSVLGMGPLFIEPLVSVLEYEFLDGRVWVPQELLSA